MNEVKGLVQLKQNSDLHEESLDAVIIPSVHKAYGEIP